MKKKYKLVLGLVALLITLTSIEAAMKLISSYDYVGFVKSEGQGNFYSIAMEAQAYNSTCQIDLEKANEQLEAFRKIRDEANKDILQWHYKNKQTKKE